MEILQIDDDGLLQKLRGITPQNSQEYKVAMHYINQVDSWFAFLDEHTVNDVVKEILQRDINEFINDNIEGNRTYFRTYIRDYTHVADAILYPTTRRNIGRLCRKNESVTVEELIIDCQLNVNERSFIEYNNTDITITKVDDIHRFIKHSSDILEEFKTVTIVDHNQMNRREIIISFIESTVRAGLEHEVDWYKFLVSIYDYFTINEFKQLNYDVMDYKAVLNGMLKFKLNHPIVEDWYDS